MDRKHGIWFFLTLVMLIIVYLVAGTYYETDDEGLYKIAFHNAPTFTSFYLIHHALTKYIYIYLYQVNGHIPWYDILNYFFLLIAIYKISNILYREFFLMGKRENGWRMLCILISVSFFYWHFISFNYLRLAILLGATSAWDLGRYYLSGKRSYRIFIYNAALFFWAVNTRLEGAWLGAIISIPAQLIIYSAGIRKFTKVVMVLVALTIPVLALNYLRDSDKANESFVKREKYIFSMFEGQYANFSIPLNTPLDSIGTESIKRFFLVDQKGVSFDFLDAVFDRPVISWKNFADTQRNAYKLLYALQLSFIKGTLPFFLLIMLSLLCYKNRKSILAVAYAMYGLFLFSLIVWLLKAEPRVLEPGMNLLLFFLCVLFLKITPPLQLKRATLFLMFIIIGVTAAGFLTHQEPYQSLSEDSKEREIFIENLRHNLSDKTVFINNSYYHFALANPFCEYSPSITTQVISTDIPYINIPAQLTSFCGPTNYLQFLDCWQHIPNAVLVSDSGYVDFIKRYTKIVYNRNLIFTNIDSLIPNHFITPDGERKCNYYRLENK